MPVEQLNFTDRPRGKGVDPDKTGYQIKACSPGLSRAARDQLAGICVQHGRAFSIALAPQAASERLERWRSKMEQLVPVPPEVLAEFPVVWSYDQLAEESYALTRVSFVGWTNDGRMGNFHAHALVFAPGELASHAFHPLSLAGSRLLRSEDASDETTLPALPDLGAAPDAAPAAAVLATAPFREHVAALVAALATATPARRPVLICLADWRQGVPLVAALLGLLPGAERCRTTFCTYQSDRKWMLPTATGDRPTHLAAAHHLVVLSNADGRPLDLRPDEYEAQYAVFNFAENKFSPARAPGPYAALAAEGARAGRLDRVRELHRLLERFGLEHQRDAWDRLVPAAGLRDERFAAELIPAAVQAAASVATDPAAARVALEESLGPIRRLAGADSAALLSALGHEVPRLADLAAGAEEPARRRFLDEVQALAGCAIAEGRVSTAAALTGLCGAARDEALLALLGEALRVEPAPPAASPADREHAVDLFLDGLRAAEAAPQAALPIERLLATTFRAGRDAGQLPKVWSAIGESVVKARLRGDWDAGKQKLATELLGCVPPDACPDARVWLELKLLRTAPLARSELLPRLAAIAHQCAAGTDPERLAETALAAAREILPDDAHGQAEAFAHMAQAAYDTPLRETFVAAYSREAEKLDPKPRTALRTKLAAAGLGHILAREMIGDLLPWEERESLRKAPLWKPLLEKHADFQDSACQQVAESLTGPEASLEALPLAEMLLSLPRRPQAVEPGAAALAGAIVGTLPIGPMPDPWRKILAALPAGVSDAAHSRVRILNGLGDLGQRAERRDWTVSQLQAGDCPWLRDLAALHPEEKDEAIDCCLEKFAALGVLTAGDAQGLVTFLEAAGVPSPEEVAGCVVRLLAGRDPVSVVLAATAFAHCALGEASRSPRWPALFAALTARLDKPALQLLQEHLAKRPGRRTEDSERRLDELCVAAGLARPKPPPVAATPASPGAKPAKPAGGWLSWATRTVRDLVAKPEPPPSGRQKPGGK